MPRRSPPLSSGPLDMKMPLSCALLLLASTPAWSADPPSSTAADRGFWAFQAPKRPAVPEIRNPKSEIRNPIDAFVLARLQEKELAFNREAPKEVLLRRVCL